MMNVVNHAWINLPCCGKFLTIRPKLQNNISYFESRSEKKITKASSPKTESFIHFDFKPWVSVIYLRICDPKKQTSLFGNRTRFTHSHVPPKNFKDIYIFFSNESLSLDLYKPVLQSAYLTVSFASAVP